MDPNETENVLKTLQDLHWYDHLDERQLIEVAFARTYADCYAHGTTGHTQLMLIAKLADLLDQYEGKVNEL